MDLKYDSLFISINNRVRLEKHKLRYFKEINIFDSDKITTKKHDYTNRIVTHLNFEVTKKGNFKNDKYSDYYRKEVSVLNSQDNYYKNDYFQISKIELISIYKDVLEKIKKTSFKENFPSSGGWYYFKETNSKEKAINIGDYLNGYSNNLDIVFN